MDAAVIVALIALAGTVANAGLTSYLEDRSVPRRARERSGTVHMHRRAAAISAAPPACGPCG